jgi:dTDP-4-dehydrorhamnose reductase
MLGQTNDIRRILLLGRNGQTGWELERALAPLGTVVALARGDVDLVDGMAIRRAVRDCSPALIVNAAAYNAVDKAEEEEALANAVNGEAPGILAEEARQLDAMLVHYSTDYVFGREVFARPDGSPRPFTEHDPPAPLGAYGRSKLAGEEAIRAVDCSHLIFRTSWVYSRRGRTFLAKLLRREIPGEQLRIVNDQVSCPTWARSLAEATAQILAACWATGDVGEVAAKGGTFHLAGQGWISRYGFARAVFALFEEQGNAVPRLAAISSADYPSPAARPAFSALDSGKAREMFGVAVPEWRAGLALCLAE